MKGSGKHKCGFFIYADDWRGDEALAMCSEGARLLWLEMLLIMNKSDGFMMVNGNAPSPGQVAAITRTDPGLVVDRLRELRENGVYSVNKAGVIYSRRMVRDAQRARISRENGKKNRRNAQDGSELNELECNDYSDPGNPDHILNATCSRARIPSPSPSLNLNHQESTPPITPPSLAPADGVGFDPEPPIETPHQPGVRVNGGMSDHPVPSLFDSGGTEPPRAARAPKADAIRVSQADFDRFWDLVPKKVGKLDAEKKFFAAIKSGQVTVDELIAGMRRYAQHIRSNSTDDQYVSHPASWLNKGRWHDELKQKPQKSKIRAGTDFL